MRKLPNIIYIFLLIIASSCQFGQKDDKCLIIGQVHGDFSETFILKELGIQDVKDVDSAQVDSDGSFQIEFKNDTANIYALQLDNDFYITLIIKGGDTIGLEVDFTKTPISYSVSGNHESMLMSAYEKHSNVNFRKIDSLRVMFEQSKDDPGFFAIRSLIDQAYQDVLIDQQVYAREFIQQQPGSLASLVVLNRKFKQINLFHEAEDYSFYSMIDSSLSLSHPGNKHVLKHHEITVSLKEKFKSEELAASQLSIGKVAPDMTMNGWNGQDYLLSDLRGNWVVLYFWAAGDARSRQINKELRTFYSFHKDKGLEVYAVSLDNSEDIWQSAIKLDQLNWIHVSDFKSIYSPVIKLYQVPEKLPYFFLLDQDGVIMFKGHNYGELEEILITSLGESS